MYRQVMNAQQRTPTRDEVSDPERLHRLLVQMADNFNRLQGVKPNEMGNAENAGVIAKLARNQEQNVLSGVTSGAAALVQLGVDPIATKKSNLTAEVAPTATDDISLGYGVGSIWIDLSGPDIYMLVRSELTNAQWIQIN